MLVWPSDHSSALCLLSQHWPKAAAKAVKASIKRDLMVGYMSYIFLGLFTEHFGHIWACRLDRRGGGEDDLAKILLIRLLFYMKNNT